MFGSLGAAEIGAILLIIIILFGAKRLPAMGRSIGEGIREFRNVGKAIIEDPIIEDVAVEDDLDT